MTHLSEIALALGFDSTEQKHFFCENFLFDQEPLTIETGTFGPNGLGLSIAQSEIDNNQFATPSLLSSKSIFDTANIAYIYFH